MFPIACKQAPTVPEADGHRLQAVQASYHELLQTQQFLYPAESELAQTRRDELISLVQFYKVLGGGWKLSDTAWLEPK